MKPDTAICGFLFSILRRAIRQDFITSDHPASRPKVELHRDRMWRRDEELRVEALLGNGQWKCESLVNATAQTRAQSLVRHSQAGASKESQNRRPDPIDFMHGPAATESVA
jgi:hypothetical protein